MKNESLAETFTEEVEVFIPTQVQHKHLYSREGIKKGHKRFVSTQNVEQAFSVQPAPQPHQENKRRHRRTQSNTAVEFTRIMGANPNSYVSEIPTQYIGTKLSKIVEVPSPINETPQESKTYLLSSIENQNQSQISIEKISVDRYKSEIQEIRNEQIVLQQKYNQLQEDFQSIDIQKIDESKIKQRIQEELTLLIQNEQFREFIQQIIKEEQLKSNELVQAKTKISSLERAVQSKDKEILKLKAQLNIYQSKRGKK